MLAEPPPDHASRLHCSDAALLAVALLRVWKETSIPRWTVRDLRATFQTHAVRAIEDGLLGVYDLTSGGVRCSRSVGSACLTLNRAAVRSTAGWRFESSQETCCDGQKL